MGTRRKSRELVLQMLFQADMGKQTPELVRKTFWAERTNVEEEVRGFADDLFRVASDRLEEMCCGERWRSSWGIRRRRTRL
jgi:N utilization substance protein B